MWTPVRWLPHPWCSSSSCSERRTSSPIWACTTTRSAMLRYTRFTRYNSLSNRLYNRFDNWLDVCTHDTTCCPAGCQTGLTSGLAAGCNLYRVNGVLISARKVGCALASDSSMPNEDRSLQTFRIQVECGLPGGLLKLFGGCANRIRLASANSFTRVRAF